MRIKVTPGEEASPQPNLDGEWVPAPSGLLAGLKVARRFTGKADLQFPWVQYIYLVEGRLLASDNLSIVEIDLLAPTLGPARFTLDDVSLLQKLGQPDSLAFAADKMMFRWQGGTWCVFRMQLAGLAFAQECRSLLERWWSSPEDERSPGGWNATTLTKVTQVAEALDTRRSPATFCFAHGRGLMIKPAPEIVAV